MLTEIVSADAANCLAAALPLLGALDGEDAAVPSRDDLVSVRGLGWPWREVADVAAVLASLYRRDGLEALARRLLRPDGFPERLFQLAVLGEVISAAEAADAKAASIRPIGHMTDGPVYQIQVRSGQPWDLWCEAERCWAEYGTDDRYYRLARAFTQEDGSPFRPGHLRPDILLALPGARAIVLECKYSSDPSYLASGTAQAHLYAAQLAPSFKDVEAWVIGPSELVPEPAMQDIHGIIHGVASCVAIGQRITNMINAEARHET